MERKVVSGMMLTLLLIGVLRLTFNVQPARATIIRVPIDYSTIQEAVNKANPGDTIFVYNGTYYERVVVNKTLTLIGEGRSITIINGIGLNYTTGALVTIVADNVNMSGFTVTNAVFEGILVEDSRYCEIHETIVCFTGDRGIVFGGGGNNKAYNNVAYNTSAYGGIEAIWSNNNTMYNNFAYFNQWGIATNHGSYNLIYNNTVYSNWGNGIHIDWPSTGNIVSNNNVSSNTNAGIGVINHANKTVINGNKISGSFFGVLLKDSCNNSIYENTITEIAVGIVLESNSNENSIRRNTLVTSYNNSILLFSSSLNTISENLITNNNYGIGLHDSSNLNTVSGNTITNNECGVEIHSSANNTLYHNNFIDNTKQVDIPTPGYANFWDDGYPSGGNYWSDYTGIDLYSGPNQNDPSSDGIGDFSYTVDLNNPLVRARADRYPLMEPWRPSVYVELQPNPAASFRIYGVEYWFWSAVVTQSPYGTGNIVMVGEKISANVYNISVYVDSENLLLGEKYGWLTSLVANGIVYPEIERCVSVQSALITIEETDTNFTVSVSGPTSLFVTYTPYGGNSTFIDDPGDRPYLYDYDEDGFWSYSIRRACNASGTFNNYTLGPTNFIGGAFDIVDYEWYDLERLLQIVYIELQPNPAASFMVDSVEYRFVAAVVTASPYGTGNLVIVIKNVSANVYNISVYVDSENLLLGEKYGWLTSLVYPACVPGNYNFEGVQSASIAFEETDTNFTVTVSGPTSLFVTYTPYGVGSTDIEDPGDRPYIYDYDEDGFWSYSIVRECNASGVFNDYLLDSNNFDWGFYDIVDYEWYDLGKLLRPPSTQFPWSMFHHNLRHTGYTESPAPRTNQTLWNYTTSGPVYSSPAVAQGMVFVGSGDGKVYALEQYTGEQVWNYTTGGPVWSSPAVADGKVYVGSMDNKTYCLDAATGAHIWSYTTSDWVLSSPAVVYGKVYMGSYDGKIYCLDASTGDLIWNYTTGDVVFSSPAVADGKIYVGSADNKTYCLDASTGDLIWNYTTGYWVISSPAVADGKVYVGSADSRVYCLDAATGDVIWNYTTGGPVWSSPAVADGKVYVGSADNKTYCLDASTGDLVWNYTTGRDVRSSPAVADGKVFVGSGDDKVYCLDASTKDLIWSYTTSNWVISSPAVADGILFVGSNDGTVYALGNIVRVPEDYSTIQEAIDASTPGSTIIVAPGKYRLLQPLIINKLRDRTILGMLGSSAEFDGGGSGIAFNITDSSEITITNIIITNCEQGMFLENSSDCTIYRNIFDDNIIAINLTDSSTGNAIYANTISENEVGIDLSDSGGNIVYHNSFVNNIENVKSEKLSNVWDNGYPSGGNYWSDHTGPDDYRGPSQNEPGSDGIYDMAYSIDTNNQDNYPLTKPYGGPYDIGVTNIATSKTLVCQGYNVDITVKILNYGMYNEIFTLTVYADTTPVNTPVVITLTSRNSTTITFTWNTLGFDKGVYTIWTTVTIVSGETDTGDNSKTDDTVRVNMVGDIAPEFGVVNIVDVVKAAIAYDTRKGDLNYNPNADIDCNGWINIVDVVIAAIHYGERDP